LQNSVENTNINFIFHLYLYIVYIFVLQLRSAGISETITKIHKLFNGEMFKFSIEKWKELHESNLLYVPILYCVCVSLCVCKFVCVQVCVCICLCVLHCFVCCFLWFTFEKCLGKRMLCSTSTL